MAVIHQLKIWLGLAICVIAIAPKAAFAQRDVHWQINPRGFPADVSVFVDVEENSVFKRDLTAAAFAISMDEFAGDQGGWIVNQQPVQAGQAGAQVLIIIDRSRSYTEEFDTAKKVMETIVRGMDPARDTVAVATAPSEAGYSEGKLAMGFTSDQNALLTTIRGLSPLPSGNNSGARACNAISEGLKWFPESPSDKYRLIIFLTGGADKGEGKGNCVADSYAAGKVPIFPMVFTLDRKYDDPRNSHKIENETFDLAQKTGGRSVFRRSQTGYDQFVGIMWNRVRSQYFLKVTFPCYRAMPIIDHTSVLKVDGRDVDGIKFQATSAPAPIPSITALYPTEALRRNADDGNAALIIDGSGFCGLPGTVRVFVGDAPLAPEFQNPFRIKAPLNSAVKTGKVKVVNAFGQSGESLVEFKIVEGQKGAEASATLTALVIGLVALAVIAVLMVSMKTRKAKGSPIPLIPSPPPAKKQQPAAGSVAKTMAMGAITKAWVKRKDGTVINLSDGVNIIGREPTVQIPLVGVQGVSRNHAKIEVQMSQGLIWLEDMGSTNGTFWGGPNVGEDNLKKVEKKQLLSSQDVVWISGERLAVGFEGGTEPPKES